MSNNSDGDSLPSLNSYEESIVCEQQVLKEVVCSNKEDKMQSESQIQSGRKKHSLIPIAEKRTRDDEENIDDDEFITVRRNTKRLNRSSSLDYDISRTTQCEEEENNYEVYISSKECLPKQIGLAKLLRSENILGITKINFKNSFRVRIQFESRQHAEKLVSCEKMKDLGYRCQLAQEVNLSYGVVKNIELEVDEKELTEIFRCEYDIVSVKRLKRFTEEGKWVDSETVRICFKGPTVPSTVEVYGCKFKVESYTFPVTQCSNCWRFGHLLRQCPSKRPICPKCGGFHANCETMEFRCINCNGTHMSFNKTCPIFLKEKEIRRIMSAMNSTYKKALNIYLEQRETDKNKTLHYRNKKDEHKIHLSISNDNNTVNECKQTPSFRDVLVGESQKPKSLDYEKKKTTQVNMTSVRKKKKEINEYEHSENMIIEEQCIVEEPQGSQNYEEKESNRKKDRQENHSFWQLMKRIKDVILSRKDLDVKITETAKLVFETIKYLLVETMKGGEWLNYVIKLFNG